MFFDGSKLPTLIICRIPQNPFKISFVLIGQVVSEENIFLEKLLTTDDDDDDGLQVMAIAHMAFGQLS